MEIWQLTGPLCRCLEAGQSAVLCTVVSRQGSAPRGPGARMALLPGGVWLGTVGGGTLEQMAQQQAKALLEGRAEPGILQYALGGPDSEMVCGGAVEIGYQKLTSADLPALETLAALLEKGRCCTLCQRFDGQGPALAVREEGPDAGPGAPALEGAVFTEPLGRDGMLYLFGGGHVGQALAKLLPEAGFRVVVFDQRPEIAQAELFPTAQRVVLGDFSRLAEHVQLTGRDYAVVMTPGHKADLEVLSQVLAWEPYYVGCMGSRRKKEFIQGELARRGFSPQQIGRVQLPIGLSIGAQTPAEIAVSVAAQLIQCRAARSPKDRGGCPA